jgi:hypothetical protein
MRPACWSSETADDGTVPAEEFEAQFSGVSVTSVPTECPGVFMEQPFERWSPRDLIVGLLRLIRRPGWRPLTSERAG